MMHCGGAGRSRTALGGFAIRCITALLPRRGLLMEQREAVAASLSTEKKLVTASISAMLERETRLELATSTLARLRSTN
jgi:hypothetical protein